MVLFVGVGVLVVLGVLIWSELIDYIGREFGFELDVFCFFSVNYLILVEFYKIE